MSLTPDQINQVIEAIKERYVLTEKNFNLSQAALEAQKKVEFMENICSQICKYYGVNREYMNKGKSDDKIRMRLIFYKLSRELPEAPIGYELIGSVVNRSHCALLNSLGHFSHWYKHDKNFVREYLAIKEMVNKSLAL